MFAKNKYTEWYYNIIARAKSRVVSGYTENHHIIPKCFGGESGNNLVRLTAREHFICHMLLVKMTTGLDRCKMSYALLLFTRNNPKHERYKVNSHHYQSIRKQISKASSMLHKGRIVSEETKAKQRHTLLHNPPKRTDEWRHHQSEGAKRLWALNRDRMVAALNSPECKQKQSEKAKMRIVSAETRKKRSKLSTGSSNGNAKQIRVTSPDGAEYLCYGSFQSFCKRHQLPFSTMCHILHKTRSFSKGKTVGWSAEFVDAA